MKGEGFFHLRIQNVGLRLTFCLLLPTSQLSYHTLPMPPAMADSIPLHEARLVLWSAGPCNQGELEGGGNWVYNIIEV